MPHTTTKAIRTKRVDVRPNAKQRKVVSKSSNSKVVIQDLRVTRKQKNERVDRDSVDGQELKKETLSKDEKVVRSLRKKLKSIEELFAKQKNGETLDDQQLEKIYGLDSVLAEMEQYATNAAKE